MASQRVTLPHNCSFSSDYTPLGGSQEQYEGNINPIFWTRQKDKGRTDQKDKNTKRKKGGLSTKTNIQKDKLNICQPKRKLK